MLIDHNKVENLVLHQLHSFWQDVDESVIHNSIPFAMQRIEKGFVGLPNKRFYDGANICFSPYFSLQWMIFLYRLSRVIYLNGEGNTPKEADQVYYLNKILHANDWYYGIDLPDHFLCEHPLGSVLGKAEYGDYLFVYQGTTVGGNRTNGRLFYPKLGENVTLFANASVLGDSKIGSNVIVSAGTYIINEIMPDNCIVFGKSPDLTIKEKTEQEIKEYTNHIWGWDRT